MQGWLCQASHTDQGIEQGGFHDLQSLVSQKHCSLTSLNFQEQSAWLLMGIERYCLGFFQRDKGVRKGIREGTIYRETQNVRRRELKFLKIHLSYFPPNDNITKRGGRVIYPITADLIFWDLVFRVQYLEFRFVYLGIYVQDLE